MITGASAAAEGAPTDHQRVAAEPAVTAEVARLERELAALAAAFDRWWFAPPGDAAASDLQEGARLHEEIVARLAELEAVRAALRHTATN
jgi:hypothetical protein